MVDPGLGLGGFTSHTLHTVGLPDFQPDFQAGETFLVATSGNGEDYSGSGKRG